MLEIPFSHDCYAKHFDLGGLPLVQPTRLVNYAVVHRLSPEFIRYDTTYWEGHYGIAAEAKQYDLGKQGPWLILFLATETGNRLVGDSRFAPGQLHWTTASRPWVAVECNNCARKGMAFCPAGCDGDNRPCIDWRPDVPAEYRRARGQLVKIVCKP